MSERGLGPADERYFERIETELDEAFAVANAARERGDDPVPEVEIPVAQDMADRVENILGIDGVAERVRELESDHSREAAALALVEDFVEGTVGDYDTRAGKIEGAVRTAVALLTEGVVAAPIEGIDRVEILDNDDGTEFVNVYYAGPIRSAGGTAQALSVLVADYARTLLDIDRYSTREDEIGRYAQEVALYDEEVGMQYAPGEQEARFIAEHLPIMLDGESTGDGEIEGFRGLDRVDTDDTRGGMCLVFGEGLALKAPKIQRYTRELAEVEWPWLQDLIDGTYGDSTEATGEETGDDGATTETDGPAEGTENGAGGTESGGDGTPADSADGGSAVVAGPPRAEPSKKFLTDLIAGRPVFAHPSEAGGFRLRYGRARNHGHATAGIHPATMHLVDDFLAAGTQIKTERPGKAAGIVPVDTIEGPTVRLASGEVRRIDDAAEAVELRNGVERVLDLGEYLVNYGEFVENNHPLAPASYTVEWWHQEFAAAGGPVQALRDNPEVDLAAPAPDEALEWARAHDAPLHPAWTYLWHDVSVDAVERLAGAVADAEIVTADGASGQETAGNARGDTNDIGTDRLVIPRRDGVAETLETLLVEHRQRAERLLVPDWRPLALTLGFDDQLARVTPVEAIGETARQYDDGENAIRAVNDLAPFPVRERAPTRVGARMGRPEKSEERELSPAVHTLFPIGEAGGNQRSLEDAASHGDTVEGTQGLVDLQVARRECTDCGTETYRPRCPDCDGVASTIYRCLNCDRKVEPDESGRAECLSCGVLARPTRYTTVDVGGELTAAKATVGERATAYDVLKGVKGLTSKEKVPEPLEKGILRAKHDVSMFKDGTVRYDMTDLPVTAVRPAELDVTAGDLQELGYREDIHGDPLAHDDQLVSLKVQDIVLSDGAAEHMLQTADFVDDLLTQYYGLDSYYEVEDREDLVGELVFGMAPHTSAAVVGRVVGFTSAAVGYAHPYFHAAKRRNCDGDEDCVMLLLDGLLNFSKKYLPDQRGGSVAADSRLVAIDPEGRTRFMTFEEFWSELRSPVEVDGKFRKRTCAAEGWRTYAFDENHQASVQPIEKAIRYRADETEQLLRVETQFGRTLEITAEHSLFRYDGEIREVAGRDLSEGDLVLAPRRLPTESARPTIDVASCLDAPYVVIDDEVEELLRTAWKETDHGSPTHQAFRNGLSYRLRRSKMAYGRFKRVLDRAGLDSPEVCIGLEGSEDGIQQEIPLDEDFAWLLGLFVAEGLLSSFCPTIHNSDESLVEQVIDRGERALGFEPRTRWSNKAYEVRFPAVFREVLYDLGFEEREEYSSSEKVIPDCILNAPRDLVLEFLRGFIAGDGSEKSDDNVTTLALYTTSPDVKGGLVYLLHRLGLVANISRRERDNPRQPIYTVTVSGGASDNPLRRILAGEEPYLQKSLVVSVPDALLAIREMDIEGIRQLVPRYLKRRENISLEKLRGIVRELESRDLPAGAASHLDTLRTLVDGDLSYLRVQNVESVEYEGHLYDLQVGGEPIFTASWLYAHNSMDAPLVMSSRIDPTEIDDEAHNIDTMTSYPREFYEATRELADPADLGDVMTIAEETLGTDRQYAGFAHTHDTADIAAGPDLSAYKTLGSMEEKMDAQLELSRKLLAVEESDVAERIIESHFLPDLLGNLKAFSSQEFRCLGCGEKYRRAPLSGECRQCGGDVNLTVHEGSVNKYIDTAIQVAEQFGARAYTKQRLEVLETRIDRVFEDDTNKASTLGDYM
jgi:DNA polymerase II large subunit